uniref:Retinoic acid receptor responder protein 2 n=1 Tax=Echeneis naucrates TaxID=173247 RepID=A0A665UAN3_ECHNA
MAAGLLVLVCAGAVLLSAEAQEPYEDLPESYRQGVDLALEQLNSHAGVRFHLRFLKSLEKREIEHGFRVKYLYHRFHLRPTSCPKNTPDPNPQRCPFNKNRPLMDCAVCYKTIADQMEATPKPYVHCIQRPRLTQDMIRMREEQFSKMHYKTGAPTLLALSSR